MVDLISDLHHEHESLFGVMVNIGVADWQRSTDSPGWTVADQLSHLQFFDQRAALALTEPENFIVDRAAIIAAAPTDLSIERGRTLGASDLLLMWQDTRRALLEAARQVDPTVRVPWYGPPMSVKSFLTARLMECWAHGEDVAAAMGMRRKPTERLKHVAHIGIGARAFSLMINNLAQDSRPIRVSLTSPSGEEWTWGEPGSDHRVAGDALDFCLVVTQRRSLAASSLRIVGDAATTWMNVAQAFAGAPTRKQ